MLRGLAATFDVLANTANEAAAEVLVATLDSPDRNVRDQALTALLARHSDMAERHILGRWNEISPRWKAQIAHRPGWLSSAIKKAVLDLDLRFYQCACAAVVFVRDYDLMPVLVDAATDRSNFHAALAADAVLQLAELLSDELTTKRDYRVRRDPHLQRQHVLPSLERAATHLRDHGRTELLEAFVLLADRENAVLKRLLQSPSDRGFPSLVDLFQSSSRPGAERLLLSYLDDPHAPLAALQAIGRRSDVSFLRHLARKIGAEPSDVVRTNLRRIESLPWITGNLGILDTLGDGEQPGAVNLAVGSSAPRRLALEAVSYVLRHGKVAGRRVAARALASFDGAEANELAVRMLEDDDPQVRAAIAAQLRPRNVPGAINRLTALLDSPHQVERETAEASLEEFKYEHFLSKFDALGPQPQMAMGRLVRRIDPHATVKVRAELEAPSRSRRKRALEMVLALDVVRELHEPLAALLADDDQFLRIEAIRVLATADTERTRQVLQAALLDPHALVQEAAEAALHLLSHTGAPPASAVEFSEVPT